MVSGKLIVVIGVDLSNDNTIEVTVVGPFNNFVTERLGMKSWSQVKFSVNESCVTL